MKRKYITPVASEERFVPNSYVAACTYNKGTTSIGGSQMRCVNPYHTKHYGEIFTYVWVDGIGSCTTKVTKESTITNIWNGEGYKPDKNATVYLLGTGTAIADTLYDNSYYVPSNASASSPCYGTYRVSGSDVENNILNKVQNS